MPSLAVEGDHMNGHHHHAYNNKMPPPPPLPEDATGIREVWNHNLREEFRNIRALLKSRYSYIAMDTEFPGVVARPIGEFRTPSDYQYQLVRTNCDMLRLIQLGLTLLDKNGNCPPGITTWQFNFKFSLMDDMYAQDSIDMLTSCGIQFSKHESDGIDPMEFSEQLITSGIVLNDNLKWVSFHSGYDFGYLFRILTGRRLPEEEKEFFSYLKIYFPHIYDIKYLMKSCKTLKGGLQEVADELEIERVGYQHQAGSDSYVTGLTFFKMQEMFFEDSVDDAKYNGHVYGMQSNYSNIEMNLYPTSQSAEQHSAPSF